MGPEETLRRRIGEIEGELALDWRFSCSFMEPKGERRWRVELSRRDVFESLLSGPPSGMVVAEKGECSFRLVDSGGTEFEVLLLCAPDDSVLLVVSSVADLRRTPDHASELLSQAIMGETLHMLKRKGDWFLCMFDDGYTGWMRSWNFKIMDVKEVVEYEKRCNAMVSASVGYIYSGPSEGSLPVSDVVAGTRLCLTEPGGDGFCEVELPGGRGGYIREDDVEELRKAGKVSREAIVDRALGFLGIPYVWGGTSSKGFDCSGLVKRVFSMEGIELPRDSDMQAGVGEPVDTENLERLKKGDLLFFGEGERVSHVAIYIGRGRFLHAYGEVRINSLLRGSPEYDGKLAGSLLFARKVL